MVVDASEQWVLDHLAGGSPGTSESSPWAERHLSARLRRGKDGFPNARIESRATGGRSRSMAPACGKPAGAGD
jgi:hypothetical protein